MYRKLGSRNHGCREVCPGAFELATKKSRDLPVVRVVGSEETGRGMNGTVVFLLM